MLRHRPLTYLLLALVAGCGRDQGPRGDAASLAPSSGGKGSDPEFSTGGAESSPEASGGAPTVTTGAAGGAEPGGGSAGESSEPHSGGATSVTNGGSGGSGGLEGAAGGEPGDSGTVTALDLVGNYEVHLLDIPEEARCMGLERPPTLTVTGDERGLTTRYTPFLSRSRTLETALENDESFGGALVTFTGSQSTAPTQLSIEWTKQGPTNPGMGTLQSYCDGRRTAVPIEFQLLPDSTPPELHLHGWLEPDIVFSFNGLSLWFSEPVVWDGNDRPWTCVEWEPAASALARFTDESGDEVPFTYDSIWGCTGIFFEEELVRGKTLDLHLGGNARDLAGYPISWATERIHVRDPGLPRERFDFSDGIPPGLQAIDPDATVYHVQSGPPCEQGSCVVLETVAERCTGGRVNASAVLGVRVDHSTHHDLALRYRVESDSDSSPYLGYQMEIPQTTLGVFDELLHLQPDPTLEAPYTHSSTWTGLGLSHSDPDMGYVIALDCWTSPAPPPRVRVIIDRIVPVDEL